MTTQLLNQNNLDFIYECREADKKFDLIYSDMIYEDLSLGWIIVAQSLLKQNGIFIVQTDYHSVAQVRSVLDECRLVFVNWLIYINEWGGTPKNRFAQKHDDILVYCNGTDWKWHPERIQIPKITAGTAFDKKGTGTKTPPSVFYDHASFSTMSKERVKTDDGHNIQWQKPEWLMERLLLPFTDEGDSVLDLFMGSGTLGVVSKKYNRNYIGIESDSNIFSLAESRINGTVLK